MSGSKRQARVRAPRLVGRSWINTGSEVSGGGDVSVADVPVSNIPVGNIPVSNVPVGGVLTGNVSSGTAPSGTVPSGRAPDLAGRIVLLDFWTYCCANCLHVIDELRDLEAEFADTLVVVGVHSPKFVHEADHDSIVAACERYGVHHPVLDDPDLATWKAYAVRAWPTLTLIDPEGYIVAQMSGEGHAHSLRGLVAEVAAEHEAKGTLRRGRSPYVPPPPAPTPLRFPGKVTATAAGTFLLSDSAHHTVVELAADGETELRRFGSGERGLRDAASAEARFNEPQGLCLLDETHLLVADTVNHCLRLVDLATGDVSTVAGTGRQWSQGSATGGPAREVDLSSPWDVVAAPDGRILIAMAGIHQIWSYDTESATVAVLAGTTNEGLHDGPLAEAWFSQPSGLAVDRAGRIWLADSESSALRYLDLDEGRTHTVVGQGLFDFGLRDGAADQALLQHPLGVTVLPDGSIAISDTYNGAIRRYDPAGETVSTLITGLLEPSDAIVVDGDLLVVESAAHRLTRIPLPEAAVRTDPAAYRTHRPATDLSPGKLDLAVLFDPPAGQKLDDRDGPATRLVVSASPPELLSEGEGRDTGLSRILVLNPDIESGVLHIAAMAASCDVPPDSDAAADEDYFPACHVHQQDWGIPIRLVAGAPAVLQLPLRAAD